MVGSEGNDVFSAATAPLTFHDFLERMRQPATADLVRSIKSFIVTFLNNPLDPESDSARVQEFLTVTEATFRAHPLWANANEEELESAGEGLEKYLMTKLFARAFAPVPSEVERDVNLSDRIATLQRFIRPEHLDIPANFQSESSWLLAQKELQKINSYKAPRDKLVCILNCCRVINNLLLNVSMASNGSPPGADDFLPVLIYVVVKANPPQLHSNLLYIQRYRAQSRLVSEAAYFYTNLVSAAAFLETINATSLSMDPAEFDARMQEGAVGQVAPATPPMTGVAPGPSEPSPSAAPPSPVPATSSPAGGRNSLGAVEADMREPVELPKAHPPPLPPSSSQPPPPEPSPPKRLSVAELEATGAQSLVEADQSGQLARDYPFLYADAGDLRVSDVELLLQEYKELAIKYIALAWAVEKAQAVDPKRLPSDASADQAASKSGVEARSHDASTADETPIAVTSINSSVPSSSTPPAEPSIDGPHGDSKKPPLVDLLSLPTDLITPPGELNIPLTLTSMSLSPNEGGSSSSGPSLFDGLQMMSAGGDTRDEGDAKSEEGLGLLSGKGEEGVATEGREGMVTSRSTLSLEGAETDATVLTPSSVPREMGGVEGDAGKNNGGLLLEDGGSVLENASGVVDAPMVEHGGREREGEESLGPSVLETGHGVSSEGRAKDDTVLESEEKQKEGLVDK